MKNHFLWIPKRNLLSVLLVHFFYINTYQYLAIEQAKIQKITIQGRHRAVRSFLGQDTTKIFEKCLQLHSVFGTVLSIIYIKSSVRFYYRSMEIVAKPYHVVLQLDPQEFSKMPKEFVHVTELLCGMKETNPWLDLEGSSKGINYEEEQITQRKLNSYLHLKYAWQSYTHVMC